MIFHSSGLVMQALTKLELVDSCIGIKGVCCLANALLSNTVSLFFFFSLIRISKLIFVLNRQSQHFTFKIMLSVLTELNILGMFYETTKWILFVLSFILIIVFFPYSHLQSFYWIQIELETKVLKLWLMLYDTIQSVTFSRYPPVFPIYTFPYRHSLNLDFQVIISKVEVFNTWLMR